MGPYRGSVTSRMLILKKKSFKVIRSEACGVVWGK